MRPHKKLSFSKSLSLTFSSKVESAKFYMIILDTNKEPAWRSSAKSPGLSGLIYSRELEKIPDYGHGKRAVPDPGRPWPPIQQVCSSSGRPGCPKEAEE